MVVDGTTPGALGFGYAMRDWEGVLVASPKAPESKIYPGAVSHTESFTGDPEELLGLKPDFNSYTKSQRFVLCR